MIRTCPVCGNEFISSRKHNKYCSTECFKKHRKEYYHNYFLKHKEEHKKQMQEYYQKNKEALDLYRKRYYCCNKNNGIENCPYPECRYE